MGVRDLLFPLVAFAGRLTNGVIPNPVACFARGKRAQELSRTAVRDLLFSLVAPIGAQVWLATPKLLARAGK